MSPDLSKLEHVCDMIYRRTKTQYLFNHAKYPQHVFEKQSAKYPQHVFEQQSDNFLVSNKLAESNIHDNISHGDQTSKTYYINYILSQLVQDWNLSYFIISLSKKCFLYINGLWTCWP